MCHCLLTSSINSLCAAGSYKHVQAEQTFGLKSCPRLAPAVLTTRKRRMLEGGLWVLGPVASTVKVDVIMTGARACTGPLEAVDLRGEDWLWEGTLRLWRTGSESWFSRLLARYPHIGHLP